MARETREERAAREAQELAQRLANTAVFRATLPKRLMDAQAIATSIGIQTEVKLSERGPCVRFYNDSENSYIDTTLDYFSEEWQMDQLDENLLSVKAEQEATALRRRMAEAAWDRLTTEEKAVVKEFFGSLVYRR